VWRGDEVAGEQVGRREDVGVEEDDPRSAALRDRAVTGVVGGLQLTGAEDADVSMGGVRRVRAVVGDRDGVAGNEVQRGQPLSHARQLLLRAAKWQHDIDRGARHALQSTARTP
jgi:hypothetical protein